MKWNQISEEKKFDLLARKDAGESISVLSAEVGMNPISLNRQLQKYRHQLNGTVPGSPSLDTLSKIEFPSEKPIPTNHDVFDILRKGPVSLAYLSEKFDRSEASILKLLSQMEDAGYVIERSRSNYIGINTQKAPTVEYSPARTLADEMGQEVVFAVASDLHAGSTHAQPSNRAKFIKIAYEEYGVRHIFDPGDVTTGVGGYRGQEIDIIDPIRPHNRMDYARTTDGEIWLADAYTPKYPGLTYYELGGNHDYWHIVNSGIDAVARICRLRDDMIYLGYDVSDIPLTDRVAIRMWHPSGGIPYSISYRLQKGLEQLAFDELTRAIEANENPKVRFLLAGHLHIEVKFHRGPMVGAHVGCFEGQTNYLKRKGLYPTIGGSIFRVLVTDAGLIQRVEYTFIPFLEIEDDWKNWPTPPEAPVLEEPDNLEVLFKLAE